MVDFSKFVYKRGFLLSREDLACPVEHWKKIIVGTDEQHYFLNYDACLAFAQAKKSNCWVAMLGRVMDTVTWTQDLKAVTDILLESLSKSVNDFLERIDDLNGRFIIVYGIGKKVWLMHDATGMRSVFYHSDKCIVASHYNLINDIIDCTAQPYFNIFNKLPAPRPWVLPGDITPINNVYILIANHQIDLLSMKIERYFPRAEKQNYTLDYIVSYISDNIRKQMETISKEHTLLIGVTEGNDSRVTMAASKNIKDKSIFFTYANSDTNDSSSLDKKNRKKDLVYGRYISSLYGLNFLELDLTHPISPELITTLNKNHYHTHISTAIESYLKDLPNDDKCIMVRSNIIEVLRALDYVFKHNKDLSDVDNFINWMMYGMHKSEAVSKIVNEYYVRNEYDKIFGYNLQHLYYWEYRVTTWINASILTGIDIAYDTFMLFNCRRLLNFAFSIPKYYLELNYITDGIVKKLWPELLFRKQNSELTLLDFKPNETLGAVDLKSESGIISGNNTCDNKPNYVCDVHANGFIIGFSDRINLKNDYVELNKNVQTRPNSTYMLQMQLYSSSNTNLSNNCAELYIKLNNNKVYRLDLAYFRNRINQVNIYFKAEKEVTQFKVGINCLKDINNEMGCNGFLEVKSVYLKEDVIPYSDKVYVISTAGMTTKNFFKKYFNIQ